MSNNFQKYFYYNIIYQSNKVIVDEVFLSEIYDLTIHEFLSNIVL